MSGNLEEVKFLSPTNPTNSDLLFAQSEGTAQFFNHSQNASAGVVDNDFDVTVKNGTAIGTIDFDTIFIKDPTFTNLFIDNNAAGTNGTFEIINTGKTEVVANFDVAAGQQFSFDFTARLDLKSKEIENPDAEYSQATSTTTFAVIDISNGSNNGVVVDSFSLTGNLISSQGIGQLQTSSNGNVSFNSFGETDIDGNNGTDSVSGFVSGSYQRTFSHNAQLVVVEVNTSFVELRADNLIDNLGNDVIYGTIWDDYIEGTHYNDKIYASLGNDTVKGYYGDDIIEGGGGNDWLYGGDGRDSIHGGSGDDFIDGGYGLDYIDGGSGYDTVSYAPRYNDVYLDLATGVVSFSGTWGSETIHNIEKVVGSKGNDTIYGDDGDNHLEGYDGRDYINGRGGNDYIDGGFGYDTIDGGSGYDTVSYAARNNSLHLDLATGIVTFSGYSSERVYNIEKVIGSQGNDTIHGDNGNNHLDGYDGHDTIYGQLGNDYIEGGKGDDYIFGDDNYWGVSGNDTIEGGKGNDWIKAGGGSDTVQGGKGNDYIYGDYVNEGSGYDGNDFIKGGAGHDTIIGGGGNDRIIGSNSQDVGAHEQDILIGGGGADTFVIGDSHQSYYIANGSYDFAHIQDFTIGEDILELHGSINNYHVGISYGDAYISYTGNGMNDLVAIVSDVNYSFNLNTNANFV